MCPAAEGYPGSGMVQRWCLPPTALMVPHAGRQGGSRQTNAQHSPTWSTPLLSLQATEADELPDGCI